MFQNCFQDLFLFAQRSVVCRCRMTIRHCIRHCIFERNNNCFSYEVEASRTETERTENTDKTPNWKQMSSTMSNEISSIFLLKDRRVQYRRNALEYSYLVIGWNFCMGENNCLAGRLDEHVTTESNRATTLLLDFSNMFSINSQLG